MTDKAKDFISDEEMSQLEDSGRAKDFISDEEMDKLSASGEAQDQVESEDSSLIEKVGLPSLAALATRGTLETMEWARGKLPGFAEQNAFEALGGGATKRGKELSLKTEKTSKLDPKFQPEIKPKDVGRFALDNKLLSNERSADLGKLRQTHGKGLSDFVKDFDAQNPDSVNLNDLDDKISRNMTSGLKNIRGTDVMQSTLTKPLYGYNKAGDAIGKLGLTDSLENLEGFKTQMGDITDPTTKLDRGKSIVRSAAKEYSEDVVGNLAGQQVADEFSDLKRQYGVAEEASKILDQDLKVTGVPSSGLKKVAEFGGELAAKPFSMIGLNRTKMGQLMLPKTHHIEALAARASNAIDQGLTKIGNIPGAKQLWSGAKVGLPILSALGAFSDAKAEGLSTPNAVKRAALNEGAEALPVVGPVLSAISPTRMEGGEFDKDRRLVEDYNKSKQPLISNRNIEPKELSSISQIMRQVPEGSAPENERVLTAKIADDLEKASAEVDPGKRAAILYRITSQPGMKALLERYVKPQGDTK